MLAISKLIVFNNCLNLIWLRTSITLCLQICYFVNNFITFSWLTHFCPKILSSRYTHFSCQFSVLKSSPPPICSLLECMRTGPWQLKCSLFSFVWQSYSSLSFVPLTGGNFHSVSTSITLSTTHLILNFQVKSLSNITCCIKKLMENGKEWICRNWLIPFSIHIILYYILLPHNKKVQLKWWIEDCIKFWPGCITADYILLLETGSCLRLQYKYHQNVFRYCGFRLQHKYNQILHITQFVNKYCMLRLQDKYNKR